MIIVFNADESVTSLALKKSKGRVSWGDSWDPVILRLRGCRMRESGRVSSRHAAAKKTTLIPLEPGSGGRQ